MNTSVLPSTALYRIGAVSKTTGIPVSTLRIWETRYGAFTPVKTEGKQRLFAEHDVSKALLLKQLSGAGHGIGSIARLDLPQLRQLCHPDHQTPTAQALAQPVCLAVVGLGLANRIQSRQFAAVLSQHRIQVTDVIDDLAAARHAPLSDKPQVLLIKVNSLQDSVFETIQALMQRQPFVQTIVLYHFAPEVVGFISPFKAARAAGRLSRARASASGRRRRWSGSPRSGAGRRTQ